MTTHKVTVDGRQLAYRESAGTGRPVVFVHGNSSSKRTWHALLDGDFGRRFRCLAFDLPGHGESEPDPSAYSLPGYAAKLRAFVQATGAENAVVVGWSLGGHIALEAAPALPGAAGFAVFGTPPVASAADLGTAFLPNPAVATGFTADVDADAARAYALSFLAPGSALSESAFTADILATDGAARAGLGETLPAGRFADEVDIVANLTRPLAVLHGEGEQLVSLEYLRGLTIPTLWRGEVQLVPGGHAPHEEAPDQFAATLAAFVADLG
ncbi:pimeloyl-ACP methyl ester carboxylesterase [Amycolatopsis bartoniae]|uniref:Alpha/beta hydrolase n=1 Tax=Amycolatopsis bartoniae TaxID=941986 RepID=A0A8H9IX46_9PSEU|nr:alpha/beta hydrolase [Amycolatopsis bartoniae]MBB2939024.1 pimeloyl-ACP methyl ester carboxylesterase [Amycolatopsis bartoniae]TVT04277.1 alpha/beta hydrolase [Amycolatopsis bartoniae]GHF65527.1 alpha/beta hydrolase [Amycolatopsis bartoniae]